MSYVQGFVLAVPTDRKEEYIAMARAGWPLFRAYGALEMAENWGEDVPEGKVTSFPMAVKRADDETVVFSWIIWPDKASADACAASMGTDPRWNDLPDMCFDGKRMIWGWFVPVYSARA